MKRAFFFAVVTGAARPQLCRGCELIVPHREHRYRVARGATASLWTAVEHRAPCGRICPRGVVAGGAPEDLHQVGGRCCRVRTSADSRWPS